MTRPSTSSQRLRVLALAPTAALVLIAGCTSADDEATSATSSASATGSATGSASGRPSGGAGGGPGGAGGGGGGQTFTDVALNTDGASAGGANTAAVAEVTSAFLASLDDSERSTVEHDFSDNVARVTWSNYPTTTVPREGIVLSDLTADQQAAALAILPVALSEAGAGQSNDIRKADDYLNSLGGQGADGFGALNDYYIAVYGTPSATEPFMVQFGGHHLARNLTYNGDAVSQTPQFVGSEPTSFDVDGTTVQPVEAESTAMFAMIDQLDDTQKSAAEITSGTFDDLLMGPGVDDGSFPTAEGLKVSELDDTHQALVTAAIQAYVGDLATDAATASLAKYTAELDQTTIGWSNNTGPTDENSYIRIDGPSVWIEFINTRSMSTPDIHYHSVYRDKNNDYGSSPVSS